MNSRQWLATASERGPWEFPNSSITAPASSSTRTMRCTGTANTDSANHEQNQRRSQSGRGDESERAGRYLLDAVEALQRAALAVRRHHRRRRRGRGGDCGGGTGEEESACSSSSGGFGLGWCGVGYRLGFVGLITLLSSSRNIHPKKTTFEITWKTFGG
jgi:hypothetical protein